MTEMRDNEELIRYRKARNFIYKMGLRAETRNEHGCHIHVCNMEIKQEQQRLQTDLLTYILLQLVNTDRLITDVIFVDLEMFAILIFFFHGLYTLAYHGVYIIYYGNFGCQVSFN